LASAISSLDNLFLEACQIIKSRFSKGASGIGDLTFSGVSFFSKAKPASEDSCSVLYPVPSGSVSVGTEGPPSVSAQAVAASAIFFAGAGVNALVDSMTASNTLAILLLLGVIAEAFDTFGNSGSAGWLKIFGSPTVFPSYGSMAAFSLASAPCFGVSTGPAAGTFSNSVSSSLGMAGAGCSASAVEDVPSPSFGTVAISMYLSRCVKTLIFFPSAQQRWLKRQFSFSFPAFARDKCSPGTRSR
jgi:hypothetical protein